jgi:hypothetical protein
MREGRGGIYYSKDFQLISKLLLEELKTEYSTSLTYSS